jgi:hypothetical protein
MGPNTTVKNTARRVRNACKRVNRSAFNTVIHENTESGRNKQWENVKKTFLADCEKATIALISPNPDPKIQHELNPEWSIGVADEVSARTTPPSTPMPSSPVGGKRRTCNGRKGRKGRKSRKLRR